MVYLAPRRLEVRAHVHLVHVGGGQDQVGLACAALPEDGGGSAGAFDAHDVQRVAGPVDGLVIVVNDGHVMVFAGEIVGQGRAYLAGAYDEYIHGMSAFLFLSSLSGQFWGVRCRTAGTDRH